MSAASCSSELVEWESTPPKKQELVAGEKMERANSRLLAIKQALASMETDKPPCVSIPRSFGQSITTNSMNGKRPSLDSIDGAVPMKKPRQLPPSWRDDALSNSSFSSPSSTTRSTNEGRFAHGSSARSDRESRRYTVPTPSSSAGPSSSSASSSQNKVAKLFLSQEQTHILKLVQEGSSVFYTGSAGTGKSVLLREIIKTMKQIHAKNAEAVAITASTGIAACNIGGITIHSFAGIGLGNESAEVLADKVKKNKKALMRWLKAKVLIIDEVSMVDGDLFDKLAKIGGIVRKRPSEPFGGIQAGLNQKWRET